MIRVLAFCLIAACGGTHQARSLDWLAGDTGTWRTEHGGNVVIQKWNKSVDGWSGTGVVKQGQAVVGGEQHRISVDRGMMVLLITPHGQPDSLLELEAQGEQKVSFVSSDRSAFPARVVYERKGAQLRVRIEGADGRGVEHLLAPSTE